MSELRAREQELSAWIARTTGVGGARIVRELSGGNSNLTLLLETETHGMVLRTPPQATISPSAHRGIEREARVLTSLEGRVRVPRVIAWCEDAAIIGRPFLLVEHVDGVSITDTLPEAYPDTAASVNALGEQLVDELAAIHTVPWQDIGLEGFGNPANFLERQIGRWRETRAKSAVRELPELEQLAQWLLDNLPAHAPAALVHGDFHLDNTLCRRDGPLLAAVIDWELATIGDPLTDLGLFLMFWGPRRADPPGFARIQAVSRRPGTVSRRELAERWSRATGIAIDALPFYLCFAFWRLAAIVEGAWILQVQGKVDSAYARGLEHDVPALLEEARAAADGAW